MERALLQATRCKSDCDRPRPKVGAVLVNMCGELLGEAHRGEDGPDDHAEFVVFKKVIRNAVVGATLYTTLEPCTVRRPPKPACIQYVLASGVARVVIGIADPIPANRGRSILALHANSIDVGFFDDDLARQVREINASVWRL